MPSASHEGPLEVLRNAPDLVAELLRRRLGEDLPPYASIQIEDTDFTQLTPTAFRADLVLTFCAADGRAALSVVVEVQRSVDDKKRTAWPVYLAAEHARTRCRSELLIVTFEPEVARWARAPIRVGHCMQVRPLVADSTLIPRITSVGEARKNVALAVLSALAHARGSDDTPVATAALEAAFTAGLDSQRLAVYHDVIRAAHDRFAATILESIVKNYEFQSDFAKKHIAIGRTEGRVEGRTEGRTEGRVEGRAEGRVDSLLLILDSRRLPVTEAQRARIRAASDVAQLERWIQRALSCGSVEEMFSDG